MDLVHERGSMDLVHESGPWTWSKVGVHGPLVHVLSSPQNVPSGEERGETDVFTGYDKVQNRMERSASC